MHNVASSRSSRGAGIADHVMCHWHEWAHAQGLTIAADILSRVDHHNSAYHHNAYRRWNLGSGTELDDPDSQHRVR